MNTMILSFPIRIRSVRPPRGGSSPLVMSVVRPKRVVDVGCGIGAWLRIFKEQGCEVKGYDGDYVKRTSLVIEPSEFHAADLSLPLRDADAPYDLA